MFRMLESPEALHCCTAIAVSCSVLVKTELMGVLLQFVKLYVTPMSSN